MIVLLRMHNDETKKAIVRNRIFHEVNTLNRKLEALTTSKIKAVFWPDKKGMTEVPVKTWLESAESNEYWGLAT